MVFFTGYHGFLRGMQKQSQLLLCQTKIESQDREEFGKKLGVKDEVPDYSGTIVNSAGIKILIQQS